MKEFKCDYFSYLIYPRSVINSIYNYYLAQEKYGRRDTNNN